QRQQQRGHELHQADQAQVEGAAGDRIDLPAYRHRQHLEAEAGADPGQPERDEGAVSEQRVRGRCRGRWHGESLGGGHYPGWPDAGSTGRPAFDAFLPLQRVDSVPSAPLENASWAEKQHVCSPTRTASASLSRWCISCRPTAMSWCCCGMAAVAMASSACGQACRCSAITTIAKASMPPWSWNARM